MLLHSEPRPKSADIILKRSAKKFHAAAFAGGWSIHMHSNGGGDNLVIEARDLMTALAPEVDTYATVRIVARFNYESGSFDSAETFRLQDHYQQGRFVNEDYRGYGSDKVTVGDLVTKLEQGPIWREAQANEKARVKAEQESTKLRHAAMLTAARATTPSPEDEAIREQLRALVAKRTAVPLLDKVYGNRYDEAIEEWYVAKEIASIAGRTLDRINDIVGEFPNERVLTPRLAAAFAAEAVVGEWADDRHPSRGETEARRQFVSMFHPHHGSNGNMQGVEVLR